MIKETLKTVEKVWGEELWLVNNEQYCGKLLIVDKDGKSSYHCHRLKRETFMAIEGYARLIVEGKEHLLAPYTRAKTIEPGEYHCFEGITQAVLLEISTHHDDDDVERLNVSRDGGQVVESTPGQPQ